MEIKQWIELVLAIIALGTVGWGFSKTWTTFSLKLENIEIDITDMKEAEKVNHKASIDRIEEMRKERHDELSILRNELSLSSRESRDENKQEHKEIKDSLKNVERTLIEVVTEIRLSKSQRQKDNGGIKTKEKETVE